MDTSRLMWTTFAVMFLIGPACGMMTLMAKYNMGGVNGTVTFMQNAVGGDVNIILNLDGMGTGSYTLQLHEYRVNFDRQYICSVENVGAIHNWTQQIGAADATSGKGNLTATGMDLSGIKSIEGRSFVITNGSSFTVCATIEADADYITAFAHLPAGLGGTIIFRQKESSPSSDTFMYLDLYFVDAVKVSGPLKWQINEGQVRMDINADTALADRCGNTIMDLYNPNGMTGTSCTTGNHSNCKIGDLSGKHGDITVQTSGNTKFFFADLNLPLSGENSVIGRTIAFMNGNEYFACANINRFSTMSAVSDFSNNGVKGKIELTQRSPLDPVLVHVNLDKLNNTATGYQVHLFPVPMKVSQTQMICSDNVLGDVYNPFNVTSMQGVNPTPDMYAVGDLGGKFGSLLNFDSYNETWMDPNIQLYGKNSVLGRSIVINVNNAGGRICSTILPSGNIEMTTAYARFEYPFIGHIMLRQPKNMWYMGTQVYVELNEAASGMLNETVNHKWHVHESPLGNDMLESEGLRCQSAGPHYNPYSVDLAGDYQTECNPDKQLRCELGDLSGKHGKLYIRNDKGYKSKFLFTDLQLPLHGPQSIVGKSIVIHDLNNGAGRLGCGNIRIKIMRTAQVSVWTAAPRQGKPSGTITFTQDCLDILSCPTRVNVQLSGLNNEVAGYHVHEYPTGPNTPDAQLCQGSDVGGHLNPFGAAYPLPPGNSLDVYEIGDLSGKFNPLTGTSFSKNVLDINLPMGGPYSIVGRSIVIHKNDVSATRWACGNIMETTPGSTLIKARATFTGSVYGTIDYSQYKYTNGDMSDTFIVVDLKHENGMQTTGHNWHVHERRITSNCQSAGPHYNPYRVDVNNNYKECQMNNPMRCEMGDQSGKVGRYDIGSGKKFYTDVNLNLEATYSASKRSVVVHGANMAAERIACADIMPYGDSIVTSVLSFPKTTWNSSDVEQKVGASIGTSVANVLVVAGTETFSCTNVNVYFLGDHKNQLKKQFKDLLDSRNYSKLEKYAPAGECVTGTSSILKMSVMTVFICFCLSKFRLS